MSPSIQPDAARHAISALLSSAAALLNGRSQAPETLRDIDARTLADIGIAQVGQGPATLHVAMTDTRRYEVKRSLGVPSPE
jgi:hypothetical protein